MWYCQNYTYKKSPFRNGCNMYVLHQLSPFWSSTKWSSIGDNVALATWSSAEYFVGIITGSIPPCRMLVLQWIPKFRSEAPPNEGTTGISNSRSSYFYSLKDFSRITDAFPRSRATSPETSRGSKGSRNSQKKYIPMKPWNMEANRAFSQDSGRESILPPHSVSRAKPETGILKTVDVRVRTCGDDGSFATDESAQRWWKARK